MPAPHRWLFVSAFVLAIIASACAPRWIGSTERVTLTIDSSCLIAELHAHDLAYQGFGLPSTWKQGTSHAGTITYTEEYKASFVADTGEQIPLTALKPGQFSDMRCPIA